MAHVPPSTNLRWTQAEEAEGMCLTTVFTNASSLSTHMKTLYIFGIFLHPSCDELNTYVILCLLTKVPKQWQIGGNGNE